jgi:ribosomal protein S18 acetylase RimI-like enzyme
MEAQALHALYFRRDIERVEAEHPDLIVRRGANILLAQQAGVAKLAYSFESDRAFTELFPDMLDALLPRIRRVLRADSVRFRLSHSPSRPLVEPVVKRLLFQPKREWLQFDIDRSGAPKAKPLAGVRFRSATADDIDAIAKIDLEGFPDQPMPRDAIRSELFEGDRSVIVAVSKGGVVGYCSYALPDPGFGYIHDLAVAASARRHGVGGALTSRAVKALFTAGADDIALTTEQNNGPAIRLYRDLGFRQTKAGRDYERPADPRVIERLAKQAQTTMIKFGDWR